MKAETEGSVGGSAAEGLPQGDERWCCALDERGCLWAEVPLTQPSGVQRQQVGQHLSVPQGLPVETPHGVSMPRPWIVPEFGHATPPVAPVGGARVTL